MDKITPRYLSLPNLSKHASLSVKTLRSFLYHPEHPLPHIRLPRKILVDVAEFEAWLARFRVSKPHKDLNAIVNDLIADL
jgi:lambda repressor-like predicted transcriptional regulator